MAWGQAKGLGDGDIAHGTSNEREVGTPSGLGAPPLVGKVGDNPRLDLQQTGGWKRSTENWKDELQRDPFQLWDGRGAPPEGWVRGGSPKGGREGDKRHQGGHKKGTRPSPKAQAFGSRG